MLLINISSNHMTCLLFFANKMLSLVYLYTILQGFGGNICTMIMFLKPPHIYMSTVYCCACLFQLLECYCNKHKHTKYVGNAYTCLLTSIHFLSWLKAQKIDIKVITLAYHNRWQPYSRQTVYTVCHNHKTITKVDSPLIFVHLCCTKGGWNCSSYGIVHMP